MKAQDLELIKRQNLDTAGINISVAVGTLIYLINVGCNVVSLTIAGQPIGLLNLILMPLLTLLCYKCGRTFIKCVEIMDILNNEKLTN